MLTQEEVKTFVVQNNILGYAIAMIIALTLKDLVASFIGNLLVPAINLFLVQLQIKSLTKYLPGNELIEISPVIKSFLTFLLTFLIVFLSVTLLFSSWVVPKIKVKKDEEMDMIM
jgi:large-conductance mechanosensitive channel